MMPLYRVAFGPSFRSASSAEGRQSLQLLRKIFGNILLRRTKAEREQDVHLPPLVMETRYVRLEPSEQAFYDRLAQEYQDKVEQLAEEGMLEAKVSELLVLLMRLRQVRVMRTEGELAVTVDKWSAIGRGEGKEWFNPIYHRGRVMSASLAVGLQQWTAYKVQ